MRRLLGALYVALCLAWGVGVALALFSRSEMAALPGPADVPAGERVVVLSAARLAGRDVVLPPQPYATPRSEADWQALAVQAHWPAVARNSLLAALIAALALSLPLAIALLAWLGRLLFRPFRGTAA